MLVSQVILTQLPGQDVQFEVFDKDLDRDDFLGRSALNRHGVLNHLHWRVLHVFLL